MRNITTTIQVVLFIGTAWILFMLWSSRQTVANSVRLCPSCNVEIGKFDAVHCQDCLEFKGLFSAENKALKFGEVN
jgi:hypothetical protein